MRKNVVLALLLFAAIGVLAFFLATGRQPETPPAKPRLSVSASLSPMGDTVPRRDLPALSLTTQTPLKQGIVRFYRLTKPEQLIRVYRGLERESLSELALAQLALNEFQLVAESIIALQGATTPIPWPEITAGIFGFYLVTFATDAASSPVAATWVQRSNLQAITVQERDQWRVACRQTENGKPSAAKLSWVGISGGDTNAILAETACDDQGVAILPRATLPKDSIAQLLLAQDQSGQAALVNLPVTGSEAPPLTVELPWLATERDVYSAGQEVTVLIGKFGEERDKILITLQRPDGLAIAEKPLTEFAGGIGWVDFTLPEGAMAGQWQIKGVGANGAHQQTEFSVAGQAQALASVHDELRILARNGTELRLAANMRNQDGDAPDYQAASIILQWQVANTLSNYPDFSFGTATQPDSAATILANFVKLDDAPLSLTLPKPPEAYDGMPVQALLRIKRLGAGSEQNSAPLLVVTLPQTDWSLGLKAEFSAEALQPNSQARFTVAAFNTGSKAESKPALKYELSTERRSYRWFIRDGRWDYSADQAVLPVMTGDVSLDANGRATIAVPVQSGHYRLSVFSTEPQLRSSISFKTNLPQQNPAMRQVKLNLVRDDQGRLDFSAMREQAASLAFIAGDMQTRALQVASQAADDQSKDSFALPQGGWVAAVGATLNAAGAWQAVGGRIKVLPQTHEDDVSLMLPKTAVVGTILALPVVHKPQTTERSQKFLRLMIVPEGAKASAILPAAATSTPSWPLILSNIPLMWPEDKAEQNRPTKPAMGASAMSPIVTLQEAGQQSMELPLPQLAGKYRVTLLSWDETGFSERSYPIELIKGAKTAPATPLATQAEAAVKFGIDPAPKPNWSCSLLPAGGIFALASGRQTPYHGIVAPMPVPPLVSLVRDLGDVTSERSDTVADTLIALAAYQNFFADLKIKAEIWQSWKNKVAQLLLTRQRGDGGIGLTANASMSDLTTSALSLRAALLVGPDLWPPVRLEALIVYLQGRLDNPWAAETEREARSEAFYALSAANKINPQTLRFFIEKQGNDTRHAWSEALLAASLQAIGDREQGQNFADRSLAQFPSLKTVAPRRLLASLAVLLLHKFVDSTQALEILKNLEIGQNPAAEMTRAAGAALWPELAQKLPEVEMSLGSAAASTALQIVRGLKFMTIAGANLMLRAGAQALHFCSEVKPPEVKAPKAQAVAADAARLQIEFFTLQGTALRGAPNNGAFVAVLSAAAVPAVHTELLVNLPAQFDFLTALPGDPMAGRFDWLQRLDPLVSSSLQGQRLRADFSRAQSQDWRFAMVLRAKGTATPPLKAVLGQRQHEWVATP
jgi:hypothetical protein